MFFPEVCSDKHVQRAKVIILLSSNVGGTKVRTRLLIRVDIKNM